MRRKTATTSNPSRNGPGISAMGMALAYAAAQNRKMKAVQEKNDPPAKLKLRIRKISGSSEGQ